MKLNSKIMKLLVLNKHEISFLLLCICMVTLRLVPGSKIIDQASASRIAICCSKILPTNCYKIFHKQKIIASFFTTLYKRSIFTFKSKISGLKTLVFNFAKSFGSIPSAAALATFSMVFLPICLAIMVGS